MSSKNKTHLIILAAGNGTRMVSKLPKVMHSIAGLPMLGHVLKTAFNQDSPSIHTIVTLSPSMNEVADFAKNIYPKVKIAYQDQQIGTANAVSCAIDKLDLEKGDNVVVLFGDTPLIQSETISKVINLLNDSSKTGIVVVGMTPDDSKSYGRLVCDDTDRLLKIVEFKQASDSEKAIPFCNSGIMAFNAECLQKTLPEIKPQKNNGEYYLTDAIEIAGSYGFEVRTINAKAEEVEGVNTRADLAAAEKRYQNRRRQEALNLGCTMISPETVYFSHDTVIESDVILEPNIFFGSNVIVKKGSVIKAFSHIEGAVFEENVTVGPFARVRPHTVLKEGARIGNFVEVKNTTFGAEAKANHLSYIGDASVGAKANIGAGTIVCNYDGHLKHKTEIGEGAFIGSNSCLVAPVSIGKNAIIGAASTITKMVVEDELAVARAPQKSFLGKAKQIHEMKSKLKKKVL